MKIALLDGGLGQEIVKRSATAPDPSWTIAVMMDRPDIVRDVHRAYVEAGARVLCANTYTATPTRVRRDAPSHAIEDIHEAALALARDAVTQCGKAHPVQVAGCLPPLVASYVAGVRLDREASLAEYRTMVALQKDAADLFLIETMSNTVEALAALEAARESGLPSYMGLTVSDDGAPTLRSGESLEGALEQIAAARPDGILLNCSFPESISRCLPLVARTGLRFGAYANAFTTIDGFSPGTTVANLEAREDLTPTTYAEHVLSWIDQGATIVGGCCEVGPEHIAELHEALLRAGHQPDVLL